VDSNSTSEQV